MHHPGPPRFIATGETTQLAPRDPDPEATYRWRVADAPAGSSAGVGDAPVVQFTPDRPGRYTLELAAPDGDHRLTVRAFPSAFEATDVAGGSAEAVVAAEGPTPSTPAGDGPFGSGDYASGDAGDAGDAAGIEHEGHGPPRVRLDARIDPDSETVVVRASPTPNPESGLDDRDLDVEFVIDDRDDTDRNDTDRPNPRHVADVEGGEIRVPTAAVGDLLRVHGVAVAPPAPDGAAVRFSVADAVAVERGADGSLSVRRPNDPPEWATDATVYEIYVREFVGETDCDGEATGDARTTFDAIAEKLPYLSDLGVDCLWLTPVLENDHADHGYNITDFFALASDLGDRADYERFIEEAHAHGMRVLFDFVANHTARQHPYFRDAYGDANSPYRGFYEWQPSGEPGTYFDWEHIANLNHANLRVRRLLLDAVDEWAPLVDGFRCDMAWAVPQSFWTELRDRVKTDAGSFAGDPEFLLLDETIPYVPAFHEGMFDVHFDTTLYFTLRQIGRGDAPASALLDAVDERAAVGFPDHAAFLLYLENHDETRYVVECGDHATVAAAGALFTLPGVAMLYAGQEIGQRGRRDAIAWEHAREEFRQHYGRLIDARNRHPVLGTEGDLVRVDYAVANAAATTAGTERALADNAVHPDDVVAYARVGATESFVVVCNFGREPARVDVDVPVPSDARDVVSGEAVLDDDGRLRVDDVAVVPIDR